MGYLVVLAIVVQLILFISIFDIYFTTPITPNVRLVPNHVKTQSERVVVISVDGLRLDALLENEPNSVQKVAPYISWIIESKGSWGVSQCHLPTESRPGHVAMLAGFYEDPSAVTKGWKENPVDFDSIFNQSRCAFAWGSPDIVDIFYKGLKHNCSRKWTYNEHQDFAGNTMEVDNWVLNQVKSFFELSATNPGLYTQSKTLFFFHLLGQDTSGHTHKPKTELYRENLRNVDGIVRQVDHLFGKIFKNNKTAFVLTADHGMTDWGSHGAGDPTETLTPIVAWGAGVKKLKEGESININQADITPLLATLLGVPIPVNSIGVLPTQFLNSSNLVTAEAKLLNAEQISEQYLAKRLSVESKSSFLLYKKFELLEPSQISAIKDSIRQDIRNGNHGSANEKITNLLNLSLKGIAFYQNYFQHVLFIAMTLSYVGWIFYLLLNLHGVQLSKVSFLSCLTLSLLIIVATGILYAASLPLTYYAYVVLPLFLWWLVFSSTTQLGKLFSRIASLRQTVSLIFIVLGVELFVLGFFHRRVYAVCMIAILIWPFFEIGIASQNKKLFFLWTVSGLGLAFFSLLPVVGKQPNPSLVLTSSAIIFFASCISSLTQTSTRSQAIFGLLRCAKIATAGLNSYFVHQHFSQSSSLSTISQQISWALLVLTLLSFFEPSSGVLDRMANTLANIAVPFLLLSISHEGFFLLALFIHITCWVKLELIAADVVGTSVHYRSYLRPKLHDEVSLSDFRRAYFFLAYIIIAFFGIGNLATLNSFDPAWVRCFLTTFSPFTMTALILFKVVIPFLAVSVALRVLTNMLNLQPYKIFVSVLIFCNLMGLNFLFLVRNEGSWLDIGTSLSHYIIQQVTIVFLLVLFFAGQIIIPSDNSKTVSYFSQKRY